MWNVTTGLMFKTILFVIQNNETEIKNEIASDTERCYGFYGCFSIEYPFVCEGRPVALFPIAPEIMNVRYPMFTKKNMKIPYFLDPNEPEKIRKADMNPHGPFYIIAHGYLDGGDKEWVQRMVEALLAYHDNMDVSVIVVDWRGGSNPPYTQAVANIRLVGAMTAHLIHDIYLYLGLRNLDDFHFIGHSLGAHCGGYTGMTLKNHFGLTLGRITGMDPAEPHFGKTEDTVKLDRSDAKYVDIIHTDATLFISGGLGISESIGHVDFFPNGGTNQPGCNQGVMHYINSQQDFSVFQGFQKFVGCNHLRSYEYFIESILTNCSFMAAECSSYQEYAKGGCFDCGKGRQCIPLGFHSHDTYKSLVHQKAISPNKQIKAYLMTSDSHPFCRNQYRVTVNISASMESSSHGGDVGRLWMVLENKYGDRSDRIPLEEHAGHHKPGTQRTLMVSAKCITVPESAIIEWEFETNLLNPLTWRILMSPRVYIAWLHIESMQPKTSITVCPKQEKPVLANTPSHFKQEECKNVTPIRINTVSTYHFS